ncbi:hypothetical protein GCM10023321_63960 [Pseudonocardia eucalypti]|uniref:DUF7192 domain-containing protein n=1 Tax=Pseudonocardia eucalypti TaxID=648755 RepID=A0ABP9QXG3_9PSEU
MSALVSGAHSLPPLRDWADFLAAARAPDSIDNGAGRHGRTAWAGASWERALQLATGGWFEILPEIEAQVSQLRARAGRLLRVSALRPSWDVTGGEVDIGAYLAGVPECMIDAAPEPMSTQGRVATFLIPAGYSADTPHHAVRNRGLALAALCCTVLATGHSVEIWSGFASWIGPRRHAAVAKVISAGEPLDLGRLIFATAHPAMLRRLWLSVWDSAEAPLAARMKRANYGSPSCACGPDDLPDQTTKPYIFPYLKAHDPQWRSLDTAVTWCLSTATELGLLTDPR